MKEKTTPAEGVKTISMTNGDLQDNLGAVAELMQSKTIPVDISYEFEVLMSQIDARLKAFAKLRDELLAKYGTRGRSGQYTFEAGKFEEFKAEEETLRDISFEVDFKPISLRGIDGLILSPGAVFSLKKLGVIS